MAISIHDHCGMELISQDEVSFTLGELVAHLESHGWVRLSRSDEGIQYVFTDSLTPTLTLTIIKTEEAKLVDRT